jgi:hypothetical protein
MGEKRDSILEVLREILGEPEEMQPFPPYAEILGEEDLGLIGGGMSVSLVRPMTGSPLFC